MLLSPFWRETAESTLANKNEGDSVTVSQNGAFTWRPPEFPQRPHSTFIRIYYFYCILLSLISIILYFYIVIYYFMCFLKFAFSIPWKGVFLQEVVAVAKTLAWLVDSRGETNRTDCFWLDASARSDWFHWQNPWYLCECAHDSSPDCMGAWTMQTKHAWCWHRTNMDQLAIQKGRCGCGG